MNEELKNEVELETRRVLAGEAEAHRSYLEQQFTHLKWAASIVAVIGAGLFAFFVGKTSKDVTEDARKIVEQRMIDFRIQDELRNNLTKTINLLIGSESTEQQMRTAVKEKVNSFLTAETEGRIQKAIAERSKELGVRDFSKDIASLPTGSVLSSVLSPELFSSLVGDSPQFDPTKSSWAPADGRPVIGSRFAKITNKDQLPDLRSMFLRGLNEFSPGKIRTDIYADPDGAGRAAGGEQLDTFKTHSHGTVREPPPGDNGSYEWSKGGHRENTFVVSGDGKTLEAGTAETRPKNVAIYYYLKIN